MKEQLSKKEKEVLYKIRNYLIHKGESPSIRKLMEELGYKSPRSIAIYIDNLIKLGFLKRKEDKSLQLVKDLSNESIMENIVQTVKIPLLGLVACGRPILAEENIDAMISVSTELAKPPHKYFLLKAKGDSMNEKGINDGDIVLVRQETTAKDGDMVLALIDDEATIKEFHRTDHAVILRPRSTNKEYQPIILTRDFKIQGIVITTIPDFMKEIKSD